MPDTTADRRIACTALGTKRGQGTLFVPKQAHGARLQLVLGEHIERPSESTHDTRGGRNGVTGLTSATTGCSGSDGVQGCRPDRAPLAFAERGALSCVRQHV